MNQPSTSLQNRYRPMPPQPGTAKLTDDQIMHADLSGTVLALMSLLIAWMIAGGNSASHVLHLGAIAVGLGLVTSFALDARAGVRNLIRADIMAITAYYFLTLFEFLFPQDRFDGLLSLASTHAALNTCLIGFAGLLIGRHLFRPTVQPFQRMLRMEIPPLMLIALFWITFAIGYFYQLLAVDFDVVRWVKCFMDPRFTQPWSRGRLGDWKALVVELGLFIYLLPPMAGIMIARRKRYPFFLLLTVIAGFLFTLFFGFTGGTRNVIAAFLVTFLIAYALARPPESKPLELLLVAGGTAVAMVVATVLMLQFRSDGFSTWMKYGMRANSAESRNGGLTVDYNLFAVGRLCETFPAKKDYLGWEIPYTALIRPIPRAIWKSKPEGLSMSIEDALNVKGLTISASFAGEAYMSGGLIVVFLTGAVFGLLNGWWSTLASSKNSELGILIYSSGFFAAVISMRSMFEFTTALMPVLASFVITAYLVSLVANRKTNHPAGPRPGPMLPAAGPRSRP